MSRVGSESSRDEPVLVMPLDFCVDGSRPEQCDSSSTGGRCDSCGVEKDRAACAHANRAWCVGGPGDGEGFVKCEDCGMALHPDDDSDTASEGVDVLARYEQDRASGLTGAAFSNAADRIAGTIGDSPIPWIEEYPEGSPHWKHLHNESCAICKAGAAPQALRNVIDAVLDAAVSDPDIADALRRRLNVPIGPLDRDDAQAPSTKADTI